MQHEIDSTPYLQSTVHLQRRPLWVRPASGVSVYGRSGTCIWEVGGGDRRVDGTQPGALPPNTGGDILGLFSATNSQAQAQVPSLTVLTLSFPPQ